MCQCNSMCRCMCMCICICVCGGVCVPFCCPPRHHPAFQDWCVCMWTHSSTNLHARAYACVLLMLRLASPCVSRPMCVYEDSCMSLFYIRVCIGVHVCAMCRYVKLCVCAYVCVCVCVCVCACACVRMCTSVYDCACVIVSRWFGTRW